MPADDSSLWWDDIAAVDDLVAAGYRPQTIRRRIRSGRWQQPAPGVVCRTTGVLTPRQGRVVAVTRGGTTAVLSHASAGAAWGLVRDPARQHVTVAHGHHIASTSTVVVHQSQRNAEPRFIDELPFTPPARTVVDIACGLTRLDAVRALMGRAVQQRLVTSQQLADELDLAPRRGSLLPRTALSDITAGAHAASEAEFLTVVRRAGLPPPELNAAVETRDGTKYVDALWRGLRRGVELDGHRFHLDAGAWAADLARQNAIQATGIVLLRIPARRVWSDKAALTRELSDFLRAAA